MSRLQSLSTPSRRSRASPSPSPAPVSPRPASETSNHRYLRLVLSEIKNVLSTWDDILLQDGLKAGKGCIDEATEMDNILTIEDGPERPRIGPHLEALGEARSGLRATLSKLDKLLLKLSKLIEQAETLLLEAYSKQQGPMWLTWTLEDFVDSIPPLLSSHNGELVELTKISSILLDPSTKFEAARAALERWRDLGKGGERWCAAREWEEMVDLEIGGGEEEKEGHRRRR
ncbi:uncharacterized protein CcaverHIS019_0704470 [Cutaneotrichosporon cavernicola]|uniref:Uncharacterized protein n=1 Tax=Cutaneotrichosporon cavernicola TaxID=279322 RepID=A0AA48L9W2_9TREE|nr:uncharacterized protein CcaverHIS019_0704470 [Cutaneotrichosporon cavernicola]BEI94866.1 hypothetical protein CcaverHIS019_0704470 [Cutaneotrichosporon cavernicola]BEJ02639.1 hypothetical protein CcaverHIS631_0704340 [Cutaneotrichosporon cavernicola]BEJ10396.1 hypothetical protein CcaverHIS641_0704310 [Cutaneotrichosporon cavernicola]